MRRLRVLGFLALAGVAAALAAGCGGDEEPAAEPAEPAATEPAEPAEPADAEAPAEAPAEEPAEGGAEAGGVYRVDWETSFDFTGGFDPVGEYLGEAWGIMSNLLVRTLVGYRHVPGAAGNEVDPRPGDRHWSGLSGRAHVHVHAQGRDHVRPAALEGDRGR